MRWKRRGLTRTIGQLSTQLAAKSALGFFRHLHRPRAGLTVAWEVVAGITMAVLPGRVYLRFVDEQDYGMFALRTQSLGLGHDGQPLAPSRLKVELSEATWWGSEVSLRLNVENHSATSMCVSWDGARLTLLELSKPRHTHSPAFYGPGEDALLAGIRARLQDGPWQSVRPFGDVLAARQAAQLKKTITSDVCATTFVLLPDSTASFEFEFEAPRLQRGEFVLLVRPQDGSQDRAFGFELTR